MATLDYKRLARIAGERHEAFAAAEPYPHVVIDDFLPQATAEKILAAFPEDDAAWTRYHHYNEKKLGLTRIELMPPPIRELIGELQSDRFVDFVIELTGIEALISDPELDGAGMHRIKPGGFLNVHTDFLAHTKNRNWSRQVNLLIYLNKNWISAYNGDLELWDAKMTRCVESVTPLFNRCVIFHTRKRSFHGHPHKLACPPGESRKSIALYYFRDEGTVRDLTPTNYRPLPGDPALKKLMVAADRGLLWGYSVLKRYAGLTDGMIGKFLKRF